MLDLTKLPLEFPRRFLAPDGEAGDVAFIERALEELDRRPLDTAQDLESLLLDLSELIAVVEEEGSLRYIRMTSDTTHEEHEKAYLHFVEHVEPMLKPRVFALRKRIVASPARTELDAARYGLLLRKLDNAVALFREENVPLETEDERLAQRYQKTAGAMTVEFDGTERTLQQMVKYLEGTDRNVRQRAWELSAERRLQDREELSAIFDELVAVRHRRAQHAGLPDYRALAFRERERFDYTPADCEAFHQGVERHLVPLLHRLHVERAQKLGLVRLRPWDLAVDPEGRPPLQPFVSPEELVRGCREVFDQVDPELGAQFGRMAELGLLDLESRKGKAPGGYQATLSERRLPFIFMNAVGRHDDVMTLLHEGGHAFHQMAARQEPLITYRHAPAEFAEVASMSMELLGAPYLELFYEEADADRAREQHLASMVTLMCWIATIDAFQHWIYTHPGHSHEERACAWLEVQGRFGGLEDWTGYEDARAHAWQKQIHLYAYPFYYIEYGIAQLGALGVWLRAQEDPQAAVADYRRALALGGARPLPELFAACGVPFDFGPAAIEQAARGLAEALG